MPLTISRTQWEMRLTTNGDPLIEDNSQIHRDWNSALESHAPQWVSWRAELKLDY